MLIDTHCHLTDEKLHIQLEDVLARAIANDVQKIIVPSTGLLDGQKAIEIAIEHDGVWAMVGVHPEVLADENRPENRDEWLASEGDWINKLRTLISSSRKIVGIGEIGLDFHYDTNKVSKILQTEIFIKQLELAKETDLPVAIHMRDAENEMTEVLKRLPIIPRGQFHCFSGSTEFLNLCLDLGYYVSFCGNITYRSAERLRNLVKITPLNRLLLETDSPYLAPEGKRNSPNEPANVKILAGYIADLLGVSLNTLINQTTTNAQCLYFAG